MALTKLPASAWRWLLAQAANMGLVLAAMGVAALVGFGLVISLLPMLEGRVGMAGALVGAAVVLVVLPLALWARVPGAAVPPRPAVLPAKPAALSVLRPRSPAAHPDPAAMAAFAPGRPEARMAPAAPAAPTNSLAAGLAGLPDLPDAQRPVRDALTGAYTQQHFVAAADREWARIRRHGEDAALLMIDIDRLKGLNDRLGSACGDAMLVEVTRQTSATLRQYDLLARFGGGVLMVYLPHTDPIGALDVAERIRERVASLRVSWQGHTVRSTVSVGAAAIGASHGALDEVIADAGTALRDAKAAGRNCVRAAPIPPRRSTHPFPLGVHRPLGPH